MDACLSSDDDSPHELSVFVDAPYDRPNSVDQHLGDSELRKILKAVQCTLERHTRAAATISIRIVGDETIAEIHERTMNISGPTDVLTFDLSDEHTQNADPDSPRVEGDIVISIDTAAREAGNRQHELIHEVMLYAIHATLHLIGFDDLNETDAARMHAEEDAILKALGIGAVYGRPVT
jgi:probable rRNA maturation factor